MSIRWLPLVYAGFCYALFLATFLYAIAFIGGFGVPRTLAGPVTEPWARAVAIDLVLLVAFALQHSLMARPFVKRMLVRWVPASLERSTYVLASCVALAAIFVLWQPIGGEVWRIDTPWLRTAVWAGFGFGWLLVLVSTLLIDHFDLFGLRQAYCAARGRACEPLPFATPSLYRMVRHPLYVGWLFAFWCAPTMTVGQLLFAVVTTCYILAAIRFEERDLIRAHPEYAAYRERVPMLIPGLAAAKAKPVASPTD